MAILGVLARVQASVHAQVVQQLSRVDGTTLFSVEDEARIGLLIEKETMAEATATLKDEVERTPGVLGTWPVFSHFESEMPAGLVTRCAQYESAEAEAHEEHPS